MLPRLDFGISLGETAIHARTTGVDQPVHLLAQRADRGGHVWLEADHRARREHVADELALAAVGGSVSRGEDARLDVVKGRVEIRLEEPVPVAHHVADAVRVRDADVVGRQADKVAVLEVQLVRHLR